MCSGKRTAQSHAGGAPGQTGAMSDSAPSVPQASDTRDDAGLTRLIYGAMPLGGAWDADVPLTDDQLEKGFRALDAAAEAGFRDLDLADIYAAGKSETVVGRWLEQDPRRRERMRVQTKAGIRLPGSTVGPQEPKHYRLDARTVRESLEGSLSRLGVEAVERFFVHRWDPLADLTQLGAALDAIVDEGLARRVAVSNLPWGRLEMLQQAMSHPLSAAQVQLSLDHRDLIERQILWNHPEGRTVDPDGTFLERCARAGLEIQAWGSLAQGIYTGAPAPDSTDETRSLGPATALVRRLAEEMGCSGEAVVLAWLMRLPQGIRPVIGTTDPERIRACAEADDAVAKMTHERWYELWSTARGRDVP